MRRLTYALFVATVATTGLLAGGPKMTFPNAGNTPVVRWNYITGKYIVVGTTNNAGALPYNPAALGGKPMLDVRFDQCPSHNQINLFTATPADQAEENKCDANCTCSRKKGVGLWGDSFSVDAPFPVTSAPGPTGQSFFFDNPLSWAVIGGGAAAGIIIGTHGSSTPSGPETRTYSGVVPFAFSGSAAVNSQNGGCGFTGSNVTLTFSGTMPSTQATLVETPNNATFNFSGLTTQTGTLNEFSFSGTGSGSVPGLGGFNGSLTAVFDTGTGVSGTEGLVFNCGQVQLTYTVHR
jgi:hypothetical protein